ncbi:MAG TPA: sugar phosphate isomerase/epimerase [Acidimicrobiia bacterium]
MPSAPAPVALQLYTLREQAEEAFAAVLEQVGAMGYVGVEVAGFHGRTPDEVRDAATGAGLRIASAHVAWTGADEFAAALDTHLELGCDTVVLPFFAPDAFTDTDSVARTADTIGAALDLAVERGLTLGYHNHWWELEQVLDGRPALLHLFDRLDPRVVAEVDIYWASVGGSDPADLVAALGERVQLVHVKDGPADTPQSAMVAVGDGTIDVPRVLAAAPHARWHIVELDRCETDMLDAVARSRDYLVGQQLSTGR